MLSDALKKQIQEAYSTLLSNKGHGPRQGQKLMIAQIARTLGAIKRDEDGVRTSDPAVVAVEAGTGTGKTIAYALAAIPLAQAAEKTLVISTATVALQEQIVHKDLPDIRQHSGLQFNFSLAKGRGRYLCLSKLDQLLQTDSSQAASFDLFALAATALPADQEVLYRKMLERLAGSLWDGDRDNWDDVLTDEQWRRVTTDHGQCSGRRCSNVNNCAFFKAREGLGKTDVIVANHDLVLADLALGGGAILPPPKDCIYIFDEGHHLPDKAISHFSHFARLKGSAGWLDQSAKSLKKILSQHQWPGELPRFFEQLEPVLSRLAQAQIFLFEMLEQLAEFTSSEFGARNRPSFRFPSGVVPEELRSQAALQVTSFSQASQLLEKICDELSEAMDGGCPGIASWDAEALYPQLGSMLARVQACEALWRSYAQPDPEGSLPIARWLSLIENDNQFDIELASSPILAAPTLREHLWYGADAVVVTSATLTALGRFDRYRMRSGMPKEADCQRVASPFDYAHAAVLEVPAMASDPRNAEAHTAEIIERMPDLLAQARGNLVLFASRKQMQDVYFGLERSDRESIALQDDYSKQQLIAQHKERIDKDLCSTIFGLASMAEGVDLPGAYCEQVVIAKLPFAVPDDPVEAALSEWLEAQGRNPFMEIAVPDAAVKLVQACGRLLRTESDQGRISLLDRRVVTKRYGKVMLASLPPFKQQLAR